MQDLRYKTSISSAGGSMPVIVVYDGHLAFIPEVTYAITNIHIDDFEISLVVGWRWWLAARSHHSLHCKKISRF